MGRQYTVCSSVRVLARTAGPPVLSNQARYEGGVVRTRLLKRLPRVPIWTGEQHQHSH